MIGSRQLGKGLKGRTLGRCPRPKGERKSGRGNPAAGLFEVGNSRFQILDFLRRFLRVDTFVAKTYSPRPDFEGFAKGRESVDRETQILERK
jgi:hypothetical protein